MTLTPMFRFGSSIKGVIQASFSLTRGTSPSQCQVVVPPNVVVDNKPATMMWSDGNKTVQFSNCIVVAVADEIASDGSETLLLTILDRRWKWQFGQISGRYNIRSGGVIQPKTKKTVKELFELCFKELGEANYDIKQVPNEVYPHIDWDLLPIKSAIDQLCQTVNCHVVLTEQDRVAVYPEGYGKDVPDLPSSSKGVSIDLGVMPGKVGVTSGFATWQLDFDLVPVALDTDGELKLLEEVSYTPVVNGKKSWGYAWEPFLDIDTAARKLAQTCVWKWYLIMPPQWTTLVQQEDRYKNIVQGTVKIQNSGAGLSKMPGTEEKILDSRQFFPLLDYQLDYQRVSVTDRQKLSAGTLDEKLRARKPAQVIGYFYDENGRGSDNWENESADDSDVFEQDEHLVYQKSFQIDNDRGVLIFSDPIYRLDTVEGQEQRIAPNVRLRVATHFYHHETRAPYRRQVTKVIPGAPDSKLTAWSGREDVVPEYIARYDRDKKTTVYDPNDSNLDEVNERLKYYLGYELLKYEPKVPAQGRYPMLVPYSPDGRIAQVVYEIGSNGALSTSIHKQREEISNEPTYEEKRQALQLRTTLDTLARQSTAQDPKKDGK